MKAEFRIREVTRYVITSHDSSGTQALAEVASIDAAQKILRALKGQPKHHAVEDDVLVDDLGFTHRTANSLRGLNILTVGQLRQISALDLLAVKKIGQKTVEEIQAMQRLLS